VEGDARRNGARRRKSGLDRPMGQPVDRLDL
jgi:hypothetical protein